MNEFATISTVLPSGAARDTASVPITDAAPGRFSITVVTPCARPICSRQHAGQKVGAAAGRERHDEP